MRALVLPFLLLFLGVTAHADEASDRRCIADPRPFDQYWRESVTPFFDAGQRLEFARRAGMPVAYRVFPNRAASRSVVLFTGYAENALKHKETAYTFGCLGYTVYVMDWPGMGASGRAVGLPSRQIVHAETLAEYVLDAEAFLSLIRQRDRNPLFLFAHSTGGLIVSHLMARNPTWVRAAVLNAPLFELNLGKYPYLVATGILRMQTRFGRGMEYAIGYSDWDPRTQANFATNPVTRSRPRYDQHITEVIRFPQLWMGGPSNRWVQMILEETTSSKISSLARRVTTPTLLFQAGADTYVLPGGHERFCRQAADCRMRYFPEAKHEIYRELDSARVPVFEEAHAFFARH